MTISGAARKIFRGAGCGQLGVWGSAASSPSGGFKFYHGSIRLIDWDKTVVDWPMLTPVATCRSHIPDDIPEFNAPLERNPAEGRHLGFSAKNQTGKDGSGR